MPLSVTGRFRRLNRSGKQWRESDNPAVNRGMVDADAALGRHFFKITQTEIAGQGTSLRTAGSPNGRNDCLKTWDTPGHKERDSCISLR